MTTELKKLEDQVSALKREYTTLKGSTSAEVFELEKHIIGLERKYENEKAKKVK